MSETSSPSMQSVFEHNMALWQQTQTQIADWMQDNCLLYTSPSPRDLSTSRMPSSA